jgi:hypothetical protein
MFLRCKVRRKDGKQHRYWSVVENTRVAGGRVVPRHVLYLGEINQKRTHLPSPWAPIERAVGPIVAPLATVTGTRAYTVTGANEPIPR